MSRHNLIIPITDRKFPNHPATWGWDRPMNTFFFQVFDPDTDDVVAEWGVGYDEITDSAEFGGAFHKYTQYSAESLTKLAERDRRADSAPLTPLQKRMRRLALDT